MTARCLKQMKNSHASRCFIDGLIYISLFHRLHVSNLDFRTKIFFLLVKKNPIYPSSHSCKLLFFIIICFFLINFWNCNGLLTHPIYVSSKANVDSYNWKKRNNFPVFEFKLIKSSSMCFEALVWLDIHLFMFMLG